MGEHHARLTNLSPSADSPSPDASALAASSPQPRAAGAALSNPAAINLPAVATGADKAPFSFLDPGPCVGDLNISSAFLMRAFIPTSEKRTQVSVSSSDIPAINQ